MSVAKKVIKNRGDGSCDDFCVVGLLYDFSSCFSELYLQGRVVVECF